MRTWLTLLLAGFAFYSGSAQPFRAGMTRRQAGAVKGHVLHIYSDISRNNRPDSCYDSVSFYGLNGACRPFYDSSDILARINYGTAPWLKATFKQFSLVRDTLLAKYGEPETSEVRDTESLSYFWRSPTTFYHLEMRDQTIWYEESLISYYPPGWSWKRTRGY